MKLHVKVGTMPGNYVDLHGDWWSRPKNSLRPPKLRELPVIGSKVSWQEQKNGEWKTGVVDVVRGSLYMICRM